jgi:RimJ/RimL family protein N-acetyltransferase
MPSFPELREALRDGSVIVRPAAERDIPEVLIAYQDDPELHRRMGEARPPSGAELGRRAERAEADRLSGSAVTMTIADGDDICCGQVYVFGVDWDNLRAELGIWVSPGRRGSRLAPGALRLVGEWLLRDCGLERVQILTEPDNEAMLRAARRAGFSHEGVLRGYVRANDRRIDAATLSLVRRDLDNLGS